jgi:hypothetical protein
MKYGFNKTYSTNYKYEITQHSPLPCGLIKRAVLGLDLKKDFYGI